MADDNAESPKTENIVKTDPIANLPKESRGIAKHQRIKEGFKGLTQKWESEIPPGQRVKSVPTPKGEKPQ